MKKVISILAACMLVFSFAGMASAQDGIDAINCGGDPGYIDSGCETEQQNCAPFDFDQIYTTPTGDPAFGYRYCDKQNNRAVFPVCDCIPDQFDNVIEGDRYEIGMEILVDKKDGNGPVEGNNGVYWAEDVGSGIEVYTYNSQSDACNDYANENYVNTDTGDGTPNFTGPFDYMNANGSTLTSEGTALNPTGWASGCEVDAENQIVEIRNERNTDTAGYEVTENDDLNDASNWVIDIPAMRTDVTQVTGGWDVYVKVCLYETAAGGDGICADCNDCCFMLKIGTLCCPDDVTAGCSDTLIYPYFGQSDGKWWNGAAVTNLGSEEGEAEVTLYENGDVFEDTIEVPANGTKIIDLSDMNLTTEGGDGVLGNERSYVKVVTDGFPASGFGMMAKEENGVSMGYLAEKPDSCSNCKVCE